MFDIAGGILIAACCLLIGGPLLKFAIVLFQIIILEGIFGMKGKESFHDSADGGGEWY